MEEEVQRGKEEQEHSSGCVDLNGALRVTVMEKVSFERRFIWKR